MFQQDLCTHIGTYFKPQMTAKLFKTLKEHSTIGGGHPLMKFLDFEHSCIICSLANFIFCLGFLMIGNIYDVTCKVFPPTLKTGITFLMKQTGEYVFLLIDLSKLKHDIPQDTMSHNFDELKKSSNLDCHYLNA